MRSGLAFVALFTFVLALILVTGDGTAEAAAPPLQLPWPTGPNRPCEIRTFAY
jgi:hypothetical protein